MKRFALPSIFGGAAVALFVTMVVGAVTGGISREEWVTGREGTFSIALVGVFIVVWIGAAFAIDYFLAHEEDEGE